MKKLKLLLALSTASFSCFSQLPDVITCWQINTSDLGFDGELSNVQAVNYSDNYVYVTTEDIPSWIPAGYDWPNNPWFAVAMGYTFKIYRNPVPNIGAETKTRFSICTRHCLLRRCDSNGRKYGTKFRICSY